MYEYLLNFIDIIDILLLAHITISIFVGIKYNILTGINKTNKTNKILIAILSIACIISLLKIPPTDIVKDIYKAISRNMVLNNRLENLKHLSNIPYRISKDNPYTKIIIIIGESASKHYMSIYSYKKETTPFLKKLNPYIFNTISPANLTRYSVPLIIGDIQIKNWNDFFNSQSLVSTLKQAGYLTYWLSNQKSRGMHDTLIASLAHEADKIYFLNQTSKNVSTKDNILLTQLKKIKLEKNKKEAFFIHLIGSHFNYTSRYEQTIVPIKAKNIFEEYTNTIFYTDYIISKIYHYFKTNYTDENILLLYFSDHGEIISKDKYGHSFSPSYQEEYEIPFIVYSSIENKYLNILKNKNKTKIINLESFEPIIVNILNNKNEYKVSYSSKVISLTPNDIVNYKKLERFRSDYNY